MRAVGTVALTGDDDVRVPPVEWLQTPAVDVLSTLEARNLKQVVGGASDGCGEITVCAFLASGVAHNPRSLAHHPPS